MEEAAHVGAPVRHAGKPRAQSQRQLSLERGEVVVDVARPARGAEALHARRARAAEEEDAAIRPVRGLSLGEGLVPVAIVDVVEQEPVACVELRAGGGALAAVQPPARHAQLDELAMGLPPPRAHRRVAEVEEALPLAVVRAPALRPRRPRIALGKEEAARLSFREERRGLVQHGVLVRGDLEVLRARLVDHAPRIGPEPRIEAEMAHPAIPPPRLAIARQVDEAVARNAFLSDGAGKAAQLVGALEVTRRLQEAERPAGWQRRAAEQFRHLAHHRPHIAGDEDVIDERTRGRRVEDAHAAVGPAHADLRLRGVVEEESVAAEAQISVGRSDGGVRILYAAAAGPLVYYVLVARDMRAVMGEVAELLGRAPLPPRWALGFLQSTRHFESTDELRRLPRTIREKRIPCDGLIYLSSYGEARGWNRGVGHLGFDPGLWPDPRSVIDEARAQHFEITTHEYPVLHEASPLFSEAEARGFLLPEGYARAAGPERGRANYREGQRFLDFSNPAVGKWWWEAHRELLQLGVAGWWLDGGEGPPARSTLHAGDGGLLHNIYDRYRHQAFAEGEAADRADRRVFLLCRSGAAGMQRFGSTCWSGDINNDFATLEAQLPLGLSTGLSGVPYWGTDVGGFFHPVAETGELYARWFQLGAFSPIFRSHGWVSREHVPWAHGAAVEEICRRYAELRYRLLPYTYTLAWQALTQGLPLMRPLVLNYPDDPRVWQLGSEERRVGK